MYIERRTFEEVENLLKHREFYIYGYGATAKKFYHYFQQQKLTKNMKGFIITGEISNLNHWQTDFPVLSVENTPHDALVAVAVDVMNAGDVFTTMKYNGISDYIYIYHYMSRFAFGKALYEEKVSAVDLLKSSMNVMGIGAAIYFLAIEQYLRKNEYGAEFYLRRWPNPKSITAIRDLQHFQESIKKCLRYGYNQDYNIEIDREHKIIIDGVHRTVLTRYWGGSQSVIKADVYAWKKELDARFLEVYGLCNPYKQLQRLNEIYDEKELHIIKEAERRLISDEVFIS